jgi:hypothetical protein
LLFSRIFFPGKKKKGRGKENPGNSRRKKKKRKRDTFFTWGERVGIGKGLVLLFSFFV